MERKFSHIYNLLYNQFRCYNQRLNFLSLPASSQFLLKLPSTETGGGDKTWLLSLSPGAGPGLPVARPARESTLLSISLYVLVLSAIVASEAANKFGIPLMG